MGINNLKLTPELIAALYPESLLAVREILTETKTDPVKSRDLTKTPDYPYLGKHLRGICFLAESPNQDFLPEAQFVLLNRMLSACKFTLDDIAIINTAHSAVDFQGLKKKLPSRILFLWGISPESVGLEPGLPDFSMTTIEGISVVPVLSPDLMSGDSSEGKELKKRLWSCLQKLFNL